MRAQLDFFQQLNSNLFGATVICSCIDRYHTIPYSWSAAKESAGQSKMLQMLKWRCKRLSARSLPGDASDAIRIYCKTI